MSRIFSTEKVDHLKQPMFFGKPVTIARYDRVKYPWIDKMTDRMNGFHWLPTIKDLTKDGPDFRALNATEKHIFISNLQRQILLDTIQGRAITKAFMPIASVPELEPLLVTWEYFETIHSRTYTHIIRNVLTDGSVVFDEIMENQEILKTARNLTRYYDDYIEYLEKWQVVVGQFHDIELDKEFKYEDEVLTLRKLKELFFMCLVSVNVLEGIRFYVSFVCSWSYAEKNKMEGNAGLIKLISRDENLHVNITQKIIRTLVKEDEFFAQLFKDRQEEITQMYSDAVDEEKDWAKYLMKDGSIIGLNYDILGQYTEYTANRRMKSIGLKGIYNQPQNPLKWTEKWTGSSNIQIANQETENGSYIIGGVKSDLADENNALSGFEL